MDAKRFDEATRVLGHSESRRTALKGLAGIAFGGAVGLLAANDAATAASICGTCSSDNDCGDGRCRSWEGGHWCCSGFWSRGDCYKTKPHNKNWSYKWKGGKLYFWNKKTRKLRLARQICFSGVL